MANKLTSTQNFTLEAETPADAVTTPAPESFGADPAGLAERLRHGALDASDELARVNGWLGGTQDPQELSAALTAATGGHDNVTPVILPEPPANPAESPVHPSFGGSA